MRKKKFVLETRDDLGEGRGRLVQLAILLPVDPELAQVLAHGLEAGGEKVLEHAQPLQSLLVLEPELRLVLLQSLDVLAKGQVLVDDDVLLDVPQLGLECLRLLDQGRGVFLVRRNAVVRVPDLTLDLALLLPKRL